MKSQPNASETCKRININGLSDPRWIGLNEDVNVTTRFIRGLKIVDKCKPNDALSSYLFRLHFYCFLFYFISKFEFKPINLQILDTAKKWATFFRALTIFSITFLIVVNKNNNNNKINWHVLASWFSIIINTQINIKIFSSMNLKIIHLDLFFSLQRTLFA